jgi:hypothetical protein
MTNSEKDFRVGVSDNWRSEILRHPGVSTRMACAFVRARHPSGLRKADGEVWLIMNEDGSFYGLINRLPFHSSLIRDRYAKISALCRAI